MQKTRRQFLAEAARSGTGVLVSSCLRLGASVLFGPKPLFAAERGPQMQFPSAPRDRIAIASYPFREFIAGLEDKSGSGKMELKDLPAHVSAKFNIKKIEPWSKHFRSLDRDYLEQLRAAVAKAGGAIVDIAVDGPYSQYAAEAAERERAVAYSKKWIEAAVAMGSPSLRTHIAQAKDSKPNIELAAESLKPVAEYAAAKNVVVNLENDNPFSEDPFFLANVIEKVDSKWLRALPDFGNSLAAHDDDYAYKGVERMFQNAYNISHVKEIETGDDGKVAHVDLARTFAIAKKYGYKGYFSMEWDSPGDPYAGTAGLIEKTLKNLGGA